MRHANSMSYITKITPVKKVSLTIPNYTSVSTIRQTAKRPNKSAYFPPISDQLLEINRLLFSIDCVWFNCYTGFNCKTSIYLFRSCVSSRWQTPRVVLTKGNYCWWWVRARREPRVRSTVPVLELKFDMEYYRGQGWWQRRSVDELVARLRGGGEEKSTRKRFYLETAPLVQTLTSKDYMPASQTVSPVCET